MNDQTERMMSPVPSSEKTEKAYAERSDRKRVCFYCLDPVAIDRNLKRNEHKCGVMNSIIIITKICHFVFFFTNIYKLLCTVFVKKQLNLH